MTTTVRNTDFVGPGIGFAFTANFDAFWLTQGSILASTATFGIVGNFQGLVALIDGNLLGTGGISFFGQGNSVTVGINGSIAATSPSVTRIAVALNGMDSSLINHGAITSQNLGVASSGQCLIENTGTIDGRVGGVFMNLSDVLINSGTISAGLSGVGEVTSFYFHGVQVSGGDARIVNLGTITAVDPQGAGVNLASGLPNTQADGARIENYGTISSARFWGIDAIFMQSGTAITVINHGLISGSGGGLRGGGSVDTVRNTGTIQGSVLLQTGDDIYDGRGGQVIGQIFGEDGFDALTGGDQDDGMFGGTGNDFLIGKAGDDELFGEDDNDIIRGGLGDDLIVGGDGDDTMSGGAGDDEIVLGGVGTDVLSGNAGLDKFIFGFASQLGNGSNRDIITDFALGDLVDLRGLAPSLIFIGSGAFSGVAGQLRYVAGTGILSFDLDGDKIIDHQLQFANNAALIAASFILV